MRAMQPISRQSNTSAICRVKSTFYRMLFDGFPMEYQSGAPWKLNPKAGNMFQYVGIGPV